VPAQRHFTGTRFEPAVGYCRAIRVGERILVAGTLGLDAEDEPAGDAYEQARAAIARIVGAIEALGGSAADVVRTRMFATHPQRDWDAFARAHREAFGEHPPVTAMIGTPELAVPGCVIEIEAEADVRASAP
jgi:enamine deaminase RidA (YjgF/YER057c/UK114 family)